eukprot:Amastigsp_a514352_14.p2 type:complete len:253 gc:universal Amastigsp_a514352_14:797-39(-)
MLCGLVRDHDPGLGAELPGVHAGGIDDVLGAHRRAVRGLDAGHAPALREHIIDRNVLHDARAVHPRPFGQRHGHVDRVHAPIARQVKACDHIVDLGQREQLEHLLRRDLVDFDAVAPRERRIAAVLEEPVGLCRELDEPHALGARRLPCFLLQHVRVQVDRVLADVNRGLGERAKAADEPRSVPRRRRREHRLFEQEYVAPPRLGKVIRDRRPDDAAANNNNARRVRKRRRRSSRNNGRSPRAGQTRRLASK